MTAARRYATKICDRTLKAPQIKIATKPFALLKTRNQLYLTMPACCLGLIPQRCARPEGRSNTDASIQGDLSAVGSGAVPRPTARAALTCFWTA